MTTWLFLDSGALHPHDNMALDEALLGLDRGHPVVLRIYDWDPPGLSLGYFQKHDEPPAPQAEAFGAVVTRRTTGGGAILHKGEVTFSIAGDDDAPPFDSGIRESYHAIHRAVAAGLEILGVKTALRAGRSAAQNGEDEAGRCFYRVTDYDLVSKGRKLVGSAQRRRQGRVLHHGSIPFEENEMTPLAASIRGLAGEAVRREDVVNALRTGFESRFGVRLFSWEPGPKVLREAARIRRDKYATEEWIKRR